MKKILCVGELLVDFFCTETNINLAEGSHFIKQAGGAPANVCAAIAKLGGQAAFCGKVGADAFGDFLEQELTKAGVDTSLLVRGETPTTLAFVSRTAAGERDFIFNRGADETLLMSEVKIEQLDIGVAHFGSATALLSDPFYDTYMNIMKMLRKQGVFISFDPNYRYDLWKGKEDEYDKRVRTCIDMADFVKMSEEEFARFGRRVPQGKWFAVTKGDQGTWISNGVEEAVIKSIDIDPIDTTGAGDAFVGAMLKCISDYPTLKDIDFQKFKQLTRFSNIAGALVCTEIGAMTALPSMEDVLSYMEHE